MNGQAVGVIEGGMLYLVRSDHIGRPVFATNTLGIKVWEASYLPFGGVHTSTGSPTNLRFPGQWFQSEAGLHQNWMRDYDPTTGRYVQGDPLGLVDGPSVYGYVRQNPGRYVDPTGELIPIIPIAAAAGRAAWACWRNPACRAAAGAAVGAAANVANGWYTDENGCYTIGEALGDALVGAAAGAATGAAARPFIRGSEYPIPGVKKGRYAPFGNRWFYPKNPKGQRWNDSNGKWPHYHRPRYDSKGNVRPGQSKRRHRPYDKSPHDRSWRDRW